MCLFTYTAVGAQQLLFIAAVVWILLQFAVPIATRPLNEQENEEKSDSDQDPIYDQDYFEGDIIITKEDFEKYYAGPHMDEPGNIHVGC